MNNKININPSSKKWLEKDDRVVADYFCDLGFRSLKQILDMRVFDLMNMQGLNAVRVEEVIICLYKKTGFPSQRLDRTIGIPVFPNMVTWNAGSDAFFAPAVLRMVDAAEACLILEHKAHFSTAHVEIFQFTDGGFNFFEVSMTSSLAFLGCLLRGMTFLQPCRCRT